ncbi:pseudouridine synthase C [Seminavis robusta]|uniref:Pseudouridine synthase C n=1 Tax=Seminavis robusta TaxID=568900 RepID=A0A9N8H8S2_9STRA|nr:pseudouridine synthase C [Seminavis robusta]|eukprot:Sro98_g050520.1 pseudouridine synthase C (408) ;mRNA; r:76152-77375
MSASNDPAGQDIRTSELEESLSSSASESHDDDDDDESDNDHGKAEQDKEEEKEEPAKLHKKKRRNRRGRGGQKGQTKNPNNSNGSHHPKLIRPRIPILQYHNDWVAINKPAQMSVHRSGRNSHKQPGRQFVVSTLLKRQLSRKVWPVHRLDHRTSGVLLFAFESKVCGQLHSALKAGTKEYICLVRGDWRNLEPTLLVDQPITVQEVTREAQTEFQWLASINGAQFGEEYQGACSLVKCRLLTGRKHQIRRHAHAIGHPIIGDSEHGDSKVNRWWRQNRGFNRLFLHCMSVDLPPIQRVQEEDDQETATISTAHDNKDSSDNNDNKHTPRIQCVAPLSPELARVLQRDDLKELWEVAVAKEPRLALQPYDEQGGTLGRGATAAQKKMLSEQQQPALQLANYEGEIAS